MPIPMSLSVSVLLGLSDLFRYYMDLNGLLSRSGWGDFQSMLRMLHVDKNGGRGF